MSKNIYVIAGPTASGKSARALELATTKNGVIINCDSMQLYAALPILTAQPSAQEIAVAPHKLYNHLHPNDHTSAGEWVRIAAPIIEETLANDQTPIICGGTGLYIKALTNGLSPIPEVPPEIRDQSNALLNEIGSAALHARLEKRDPAMKERFHPNHSARIVRAWEVLEATGKSLSQWQAAPPTSPPSHWNFESEIILPDRETLYDRCNKRFEWMLENGALEEAQDFAARIENGEINENALITKALGFKPLRDHINGKITREEAIEKSQTDTRQYAKKQMTWFRNQI